MRPFSTLILLAFASGCDSRATPAQCHEMLDKYVDMVIAGGTDLVNSTPEEARATREARKAITRADPRYRRAEEQCRHEVSRREYRCAMKAPNPEMWQACID